ncbi:MAG: carboxypeptidase-like regulatory domain-containing protein [Candidatus Acidiferrales bacterium]
MRLGENTTSVRKLLGLGVFLAVFFAVFFALFTALAFPQGGATGAISGTVQDATGGVIANAHVKIINEATKDAVRELTSDSSGLFTASLLPVGSYTVEVSAPGFASTRFGGVEVRVTETTRMTAAMKVTTVQKEVEVTAQVATLDTSAPTTGESLGSQTISDLPMATRNFQTLLTLSAGAVSNLNSATGLGRGQVFMNVNGGGAANHDYRIPAYSLFAQDDWRVTKTLTLNLGYREELNGAPFDTLCHIGNTNPELASQTGVGFIYPSCVNKFNIPGFSGTLQKTGLDNNFASVWEPRIGFAYDLFGHHTTSIRGGYGIYSVREDLGAVDNLSFSIPFYPVSVGAATIPADSLANLFTGLVP